MFLKSKKYATDNHKWPTKPKIFTIGLSRKSLSSTILGHGCFIWKKFLFISGWLLSPPKRHTWGGSGKCGI